jgi:hypothetical protein
MKKIIFTLSILFLQSVIFAQAPPNDLIQNATLVDESPYVDKSVRIIDGNVGNGGQTGCNLGTDYKLIYYKFTATSTNTVTISVEDAREGYTLGDSFAIAYSAPNLNATNDNQLTSVSACSFGGITSFTPTIGNNYYILVHRSNGQTDWSTITLDIPQTVTASEKTALQDLYNNTNGASWSDQTNWNTTNLESSWNGVTIKNGHVSKLLLNSNNLNGSIPASILNLPYLEEINVSRNNLSGTLPDFNTIAAINNVNITNNDFSFTDLETNYTNNNSITTFTYQTQNIRDTEDSYNGVIGNNYSLVMTPISGTNVNYQWFKNKLYYFDPSDEPVTGATSNTYNIASLEDENFEAYFCRATSTSIPDLVIERNTIEIKGEISQLQKDALIAIYNSTNGANWINNTNWLSTQPVSDWHGVTVSGNKITQLDFSNNNLTGTLPTEIGGLIYLEYLSFYYGNNISGTVPEEIGDLTELRVLSLEDNNFTGTIPNSFSNLTKLRGFWLWNNNLEGTIPGFIATNYPNLVFCDISENNFQGTLPDFTSLTKLRYLDIRKNHFKSEDFSDQFNDYLNLNYSWNSSYYYSPQTTLDTEETISENAGTTISLSVDESLYSRTPSQSKTLSTSYTWYKDNVAISNSNVNPYIITNAQPSDSGEYHCIIQDSSIPNFENIRATITVNIGTLGKENLVINGIEVFPNPTNDYLVVKLPNYDNTQLTIFDINGKLLLQKNINIEETKIDLTSFEKGIYIVDLKTKNFKVSKKIIKN